MDLEREELVEEFCETMFVLSKKRIHQTTTESTKGEFGVLVYLTFQGDGLTSGELKEKIQVGSGRISDILRSLEHKNMIMRVTDAEDNRKVRVYVTDMGREIALEKRNSVRKKINGLIEFLGEKDTKELIRLMKKVEEYHEKER